MRNGAKFKVGDGGTRVMTMRIAEGTEEAKLSSHGCNAG